MIVFPKVYEVSTDALVPVTQEWCDNAQQVMMLQHKRMQAVRIVASLNVVTQKDQFNQLVEAMIKLGLWQ